MRFGRRIVRAVMTIAGAVARLTLWHTGEGVIGIVFTPAGRLVLVRHTYTKGWYPPGGGRKRHETPRDTVVRELREEIGLTGWSTIEPVELDEAGVHAFVVRDAVYRPRWNLELETVAEFEAAVLPDGTSPRLLGILGIIR